LQVSAGPRDNWAGRHIIPLLTTVRIDGRCIRATNVDLVFSQGKSNVVRVLIGNSARSTLRNDVNSHASGVDGSVGQRPKHTAPAETPDMLHVDVTQFACPQRR
jgi:hypothetical protein